ncbi:MAG: Holliday junction resolvase [uncultured bacterium]|nr:MAG: Holliday junction resolvase [uncultured bacterium]OGH14726.1 MAG: crossover junction endodeoxyribonuclease RuvC [Candidatus Levybacteria bacterium RIFCSPHIGHO2_01_FULL_38_26]
MKILGIDPGIARTGWGVIEYQKSTLRPIRQAQGSGQEFKVQSYGCVETPAGLEVAERLKYIYHSVEKIIQEYMPSAIAVEELFFNTNAKTAFVVGQARGVVLLAAAERNIPIAIYTPLQVKIAVSGYGRAEKNQVGAMVKIILKLKEIPKPDDVSDALAVALTHAFSSKFSKAIA